MVKTKQTPTSGDRVAYTLAEFAAKCGHDRAWAYRAVKAGKIRAVTGYGTMMIPATEIDRIFGKEGA